MRQAQSLHMAAGQALEAAPQEKKLIWIYAGVSAGATFLATLLTFLLDSGIAQTSGLSGMGMRSLLTTAQNMLSLALSFLLPFWTAGYIASMLRIAKRERTDASWLLTGFRRFAPLLRLQLLTFLVAFLAVFLCMQAGSVLLSFTPLMTRMYDRLLPLLEAGADPLAWDAATQEAFLQAAMPMTIALSLFCLAVLFPLSYFLRLSTLRLLDAPKEGARAALRASIRLMRGNLLRLLMLDLQFWWYYLALALAAALSWGDYLLPLLGVPLPFSAPVAYLLCSGLSLLVQLAVFCLFRNRVEVTYAQFYLELLPKEDADANSSALL